MKHIPSKLAILGLLLALIMIVVANAAMPVSAVDTGFAVPSSWANIPTRSNFNKPEEGRVSDDSHATGSSLTD